jgi:hypothetical protein
MAYPLNDVRVAARTLRRDAVTENHAVPLVEDNALYFGTAEIDSDAVHGVGAGLQLSGGLDSYQGGARPPGALSAQI